MITARDRFRGCLLGLAAGDAVGTSVEFYPRGSFAPVLDMNGAGPFGLAPGEWTDDTSMALCLATSLIERRGFDAHDQMTRYCKWAQEGYLSSNGRCFDIGRTVAAALRTFLATGNPVAGSVEARSAWNGCIMRLAPIPMFYHRDPEAALRYAAESSRLTHGAEECLDACRLFAGILVRALAGQTRDDVLFGDRGNFAASERIAPIADGEYALKSIHKIRGSGYVVGLEAALWCFLHAQSFEEAILLASNLGDDADTTAAVCGQVAGAFYGSRSVGSTSSRCAVKSRILPTSSMTAGRPSDDRNAK